MNPLLAALALVTLASPPQDAGGVLTGRVFTLRDTGPEPVPFALVEVAGRAGRRTVFTDQEGRYEISGLRTGPYRLRALHIAFEDASVEVIVPSAGQVSMDVSLAARALELPAIVVEASRFEPPELDEGARPVLSGQASAEMALRELEGTTGMAESGLVTAIQRFGGNDDADPRDVLFMRGSTADLKLVLLDGAPIYTPFHLGGLLPSFDAGAIGRATHHVGGAPARYDGGLSYILDLRTRTPRSDRVRVEAAADLMSARSLVETPLGSRAAVLLSGRVLHGVESAFTDGTAPYGYRDGLLRATLDLAPDHRLSLMAFGNREAVRLSLDEGGDRVGAPAPITSTPTTEAPDDASWGNRAVSIGYAGRFGGTSLDLGLSASRYRAELPLPAPRDPLTPNAGSDSDRPDAILATGETERVRVFADMSRPGTAGPIRWGVSADVLRALVTATRLSMPNRVQPGEGLVSGHSFGGYVDAMARLGPELNLRYGARLDHFSPGGTKGALRLSLLWTPREDVLFTLAGGRYHQLDRGDDAEAELALGDGTGIGAASDAVLDGQLALATADHLVASMRQSLTPDVGLSLEGYFKRFSGLSGFEGPLNSSGVDLRVVREGERITGWAGYVLSWFWESGVLPPETSEFTGRHLLTAGLRGRLSGPWGFDMQVAFSDGLPLTSVSLSGSSPDAGGAPLEPGGAGTEAGRALPSSSTDAFLRINAELNADFAMGWGGRTARFRPYLRLINALSDRDALFFHFEPWRDSELRPLAELPLLPILGFELRF